jgi:hypothetical protein
MARPRAPVDVAARSNEGIKIRRQDDREQHSGQRRQDVWDGASLAVQDVGREDGESVTAGRATHDTTKRSR